MEETMTVLWIVAIALLIAIVAVKVVEIVRNIKYLNSGALSKMYLDYEYGDRTWYQNMYRK
jgi:hypothetical protein